MKWKIKEGKNIDELIKNSKERQMKNYEIRKNMKINIGDLVQKNNKNSKI